jgi:hypothetical protein
MKFVKLISVEDGSGRYFKQISEFEEDIVHSYFNQKHKKVSHFIWKGTTTVARICKIETTFHGHKSRRFPAVWKFDVYSEYTETDYYLYVRTIFESKEHVDVSIDAKDEEEAVKIAFEWLDKRKFT